MKTTFARTCTECNKGMNEGYCISNGEAYYCSPECLHKNYTTEEWEKMYDDGEGDSCYTDWYESEEDPEVDASSEQLTIEEMKHRLEMITDDLNHFTDYLRENNLVRLLERPTSVCETALTHLYNIHVAADINSDESLTWNKFSK